MEKYTLENGHIIDNLGGSGRVLPFPEVYDLYDAGELFKDCSSDINLLDFSLCEVFSSICVKVFIPSDKSKALPFLQIIAIDPDYHEYELSEIPISYEVISDKILCFEENDLVEISTLLAPVNQSQAIGYKKLSELYSFESSYFQFIQDDSKCVKLEGTQLPPSQYHLYPYQESGVTWMNYVIADEAGCVLADEMGLGKTFQIITVLASNKDRGVSLVIAPNSLIKNWEQEIYKFAPQLNVLIHKGKNRNTYWKSFLKYDVVVTSYDTITADFSIFNQVCWNVVALDEAQAIKNNNSQRSRIIRELPKKTGIAISGTPFENRLTDVWSIFDFCFKGLLGKLTEFKHTFNDDISSAANLEKIISPLVLRRLVKDVKKDLPDKVFIPCVLEMSDKEAERYEIVRQENANKNNKLTMGALVKLREYCALPSIVDDLQKGYLPEDISSKFNHLISLLDDIYLRKEKVLIFTSWISAQDTISDLISNRYCAYCKKMNGSMPIDARQGIVEEFSKEKGFAVLILNPTVGGTGLNIPAANHVIFYTLEWNPALEDQCIGRAARIGQTKTVFVYRLYYADTVESVMNDRIERKRELAEAVVKGTDGTDAVDIAKALTISPFIRGEI